MATRLAERLLLSRRDVDITQEDLAQQAGNLSAAYISSLERGKVLNPTTEVIEALATALGVRPEYLLGWSDDPLGESQPASIAEGRVSSTRSTVQPNTARSRNSSTSGKS